MINKRHTPFVLYVLIIATIISNNACSGDYRKSAVGKLGELIVLTDSNETATKYALREVLEHGLAASPSYEAAYGVRYQSFESQEQLDNLKKVKNLIIAAPLDGNDNSAKYLNALLSDEVKQNVRSGNLNFINLKDRWLRDQQVLIITAPTDQELHDYIINNAETILKPIEEIERKRFTLELFDKGEQVALEDTLMDKYGFKIRIQHDYFWNVDTTQFVSLRRYNPENDRWFWISWIDGVESFENVDKIWINTKRDELLKQYMKGSRDSSYVTTEYNKQIEYDTLQINGLKSLSVKGLWKMTEDAMGGPFVHYSIYDDRAQRLYFVEFMQFAPKFKKRRYIRQFEAMGHTFETKNSVVKE